MFTLVLEECQDTKGGLPTMAFKIFFFEAFLLQGNLPQPFINQKPEYKLCTERDGKKLQHGDKP
jgi:hypothetical protein